MRNGTAALCFVAMAVVACSKPRIDATSDETLKASSQKVAESLSEPERERFTKAMMQIGAAAVFENMAQVFAGALSGQKAPSPSTATLMKRAHGLTGQEVIALADQLGAELKAKQDAASAATRREAEAKEAQEAVSRAAQSAYFPSLEIRDLNTQRHPANIVFPSPYATVKGELKNRGDRSLNRVELTVVLLDGDGKPVAEDKSHPVLVTKHSFGDRDNTPLKPNYARKFTAVVKELPSDWSGKVEARITGVEFTEDGP